jgi:hypothetical protein
MEKRASQATDIPEASLAAGAADHAAPQMVKERAGQSVGLSYRLIANTIPSHWKKPHQPDSGLGESGSDNRASFLHIIVGDLAVRGGWVKS